MPKSGPEPRDRDPLNTALEASLGVALSALLFGMMAITFVDVIGRYAFNAPISGSYEITALLLGAVVYLALPLTALREEHVTISLLQTLFRGRGKVIQITTVNLLGAGVITVVGWRLWLQGDKLAEMGNRLVMLNLPVAPIIYLMSVMAFANAVIHLVLAARYASGQAGNKPAQSAE